MGVKFSGGGGGGGGGGGDTLPIVDTTGVVKGSADATKIVRIEADGLTTSTTRVLTMPDNNVNLGSDFATAAQGTKADAALPKAGGEVTGNITMSGSQTVDGRDLSTDGTRLDTMESSADVTDSTNVNSAGATMNADTNVASNNYVLDEDDLVSDSATKLATQQSIKAYVDGSGFDMTTLPNLTALWDPSDVTHAGGKVSSINDQSATSFHLSQATQISQPSIVGWAKGAMFLFDKTNQNQDVSDSGANDLLDVDAAYTIGFGFISNLATVPSQDEFIAVIKSADLGSDGLVIAYGGSINPDITWGSANIDHGSFLINDVTIAPWTYYNVIISSDGVNATLASSFECHVNGTSFTVDSATDPSGSLAANTTIGSDSTTYGDFLLSHFFICSSELSAANKEKVNKKYGDLFLNGLQNVIS